MDLFRNKVILFRFKGNRSEAIIQVAIPSVLGSDDTEAEPFISVHDRVSNERTESFSSEEIVVLSVVIAENSEEFECNLACCEDIAYSELVCHDSRVSPVSVKLTLPDLIPRYLCQVVGIGPWRRVVLNIRNVLIFASRQGIQDAESGEAGSEEETEDGTESSLGRLVEVLGVLKEADAHREGTSTAIVVPPSQLHW